MNLTLVKRLCVIGLLILLGLWVWPKFQALDAGSMFAVVAVGGCVLAVTAAKFLLPRIGDAAGTFVYSSSEVLTDSGSSKGSVKLEQGDYDGAIAEYEAHLIENPDDTHAIAEIAKIRSHHLHDATGALLYLQQKLESRDWPVDAAAFLMFRIVDLQLYPLHDFKAAQTTLEDVILKLPNTRHSANAHHRIHEVQQAQAKAAAHQRMKEAGNA